ncbi:oxidoreductase [Bacillus sp. FJAT-27231]|uniref:GMC family oxidoreductase n=1 Tax=Bacillus sp. FJAT-27231 TaxID=1679168 RepID=UPI000671822D|nr:GMC family oxidoreductase [Bacillus sp. FJAT-27231]KMY53823.1 oxidoreductase [Bacillus sp. FJAT-27231]
MSFRKVGKYFDYIVIGAGTAGGVIAKELTDDRKTSVLVLEAGTNEMDELSNPSGAVAQANASDNKYTFNILSRLENAIGRQLLLSGGRVIGGSSEHNAMLAVRGSRQLYDEWASIAGSQWGYDSLRSLFKKNETYTGLTQDPDERGTSGPIFVRQQNIPEGGLTTILANATSQVLGVPIVEDYNTGVRDCTFFKSQFTHERVEGGFVRSSTATGYLNENIVTQGDEFQADEFGVDRRKLFILAKSTVNKILFKRKKGSLVAMGVEFVKDGVTKRTFARKGVIVSAGNLSSVILQRSGIGRPEDLAEAGLLTRVESPNVGYNFQTHYASGIGIEVETSRLLQVRDADPSQPIPIGAFKSEDGEGRRLQLLGNLFPRFVPIQDVIINNWEFDPRKPSNIMSIGIVDLNPRSKGTVLAAHSDPEAYPSVGFNPLENQNDLDFMINNYIRVFNIVKQARKLDPEGIYRVVYPSEDVFHIENDMEKHSRLADFVRASYTALNHYGGQCRMGHTIEEGVVDGFLNVFGTQNLKVADLSIAPILPDGNTAIPAQVIGLNAIRFLKENPSPFVLNDSDFKSYNL